MAQRIQIGLAVAKWNYEEFVLGHPFDMRHRKPNLFNKFKYGSQRYDGRTKERPEGEDSILQRSESRQHVFKCSLRSLVSRQNNVDMKMPEKRPTLSTFQVNRGIIEVSQS